MHALLRPMRAIADFALPPRCPGCGVIVAEDHRFCVDCWSRLEFPSPPWCATCHAPFDRDRGPEARCGACLADPPRHDGVRAAVAYGPIARDVALKLKYGRRVGLAKMIARFVERHVEPGDNALVAPVPLHRWRIWSRGYNQAGLIATALAARTGLPLALDLLERSRPTPMLRGLGPVARRKAVRGAFKAPSRHRALLAGRTVFLVDDVYTSGATADACARALKRAGAARVILLCWARAYRVGDEAAG